MIQKVIILVEQYFTDRDYERYGIRVMEKNELMVEVWDLTEILWPHSINDIKKTSKDKFQKNIYRISKSKVLINKIKQLDSTTFFISCIRYSSKTKGIFRTISQAGIKYGCTGPYTQSIFPNLQRKSVSQRILKHSLRRILNIILERIISARLIVKAIGINSAEFFAIAGGNSTFAKGPIIGPSTEQIHIHSADYDLLLNKTNNSNGANCIVYIDQYLPYHPDFYSINNQNPLDEKGYYEILCRFFDKVENLTGLKVKIAAHPKAYYYDKMHVFGNREIVHGYNSFPIVTEAKFVLMHYSMAISHAILLRKPIIFLTSSALINSNGIGETINSLATWFGVSPLNMDETFTKLDSYFTDITKYHEFIEKYIKKEGTVKSPFWQHVSEIIKEY
jgi:hypothetical protein